MKRILLFLVVALVATSVNCSAQSRKKNDALCARVSELIFDDRIEEAADVVDSVLNIYPMHSDMLHFKAIFNFAKEEDEAAFECYAKALDNIGRKSHISRSKMLYYRSMMYEDLGDYSAVIEDCTQAIASLKRSDDETLLPHILTARAEAYYCVGEYDKSESDLMQIICLFSGANYSVDYAISCLCEVYLIKGDYDSVIEYSKVLLTRDPELRGEAYASLIMAYRALGDTHKMVDYVIDMALDEEADANPTTVRGILFEDIDYARKAISERITADTDEGNLPGYILLCDYAMDYALAHDLLKRIAEYLEPDNALYHLSDYASRAGMYEESVEYMTQLLEICGDDEVAYYKALRANAYRLMGEYDKAIADVQCYISEMEGDARGYYYAGWCYELKGDDATAMEYYNKAIEMDDAFPYAYLMRGEQYLKAGDSESAMRDFEHILEIDDQPVDDSVRHYALHFLGNDKEAAEWMELVIASNAYRAGVLYDAACLYARMGDVNQSLDYLQLALSFGYRAKAHIENDDDIDPIRGTEAYKALMEQYFNQ